MHIVIVPDSFKQCLSAEEVAQALSNGCARALPQATIDSIPLADGGEGTIDALHAAKGGLMIQASCVDALGRPRKGRYLLQDTTAIIELAEAAGLSQLDESERAPCHTTTRGVAMLMKDALSRGATELLIGLGGSATNDAACGIAREFGYRFYDADGKELDDGGLALKNLARIDSSARDSRLDSVKVRVACDVKNPLCGPEGASFVYGPQKGATSEEVVQLDEALAHLAHMTSSALAEESGAGAAGGCGFGLSYFCSATLERGFSLLSNAVSLAERMTGADLVLTAEGECNHQTLSGKLPLGVTELARSMEKPVILFAGTLGEGWEELLDHGLSSIVPIAPGPITLKESMEQAAKLLSDASYRCLCLYRE